MIDEPTDRVVLRVRSSDAQTRRFRISGFEMRPEVAESGISCSRIASRVLTNALPGPGWPGGITEALEKPNDSGSGAEFTSAKRS
jgi:hypothetical protein